MKPFYRALSELAAKRGKGSSRIDKIPKVPRTRAALAAEELDPDMVRSLLTLPEYKQGIPVSVLHRAKTARERLRAEPSTTPGPKASEQEWADWGARHGVDMTVTPPQSLGITDLTSRREALIPGGLEGKFTIPDLFWLKANNFDPGALPQDVHNQLMQKFMRTYDRGAAPDEVDKFNALNFSLLSPNAPLTPNEFLAQRTRIRTPEELQQLALRSGDPNLSAALDAESGVGAASRGGMGVKGTAEMGNQAEMASLIARRPDMFEAGPGEDVRDVTFRVMNQVPGLSQKTASLGTPFLDLAKGNTSAVDLHMIRNAYPRMLAEDSEVGMQFRNRMRKLKKLGDEIDVTAWAAANPDEAEAAAINIIGGTSPAQVYRSKRTGELAGGADPRVAPERLAYEPEKVGDFNPFYKRVMDYVDESRGDNPDLPLFMEQWRLWDTYRQRVEPHEFAHPDWRKLPKQSFNEMQDALQAHKAAGYTGTKPVMKAGDWRELYYGKADPRLLGGMAAAGAGAAATPLALAQLEQGRRQMTHQPAQDMHPVAEAVSRWPSAVFDPENLIPAPLLPRSLESGELPYRWDELTGQWVPR